MNYNLAILHDNTEKIKFNLSLKLYVGTDIGVSRRGGGIFEKLSKISSTILLDRPN